MSSRLGPYARAYLARIQRRGHPTRMERFHANHAWVEPGLWVAVAAIVWFTLGRPTASWRAAGFPLLLAGLGISTAIHNLGARRAMRAWEEAEVRARPDHADEGDGRRRP